MLCYDHRSRASVIEELQLRLMQQALRHNVPGNTMTDFFKTIGETLRTLNILTARDERDRPPVEGDEAGPAPANCWQNRFDRLRDELCSTSGDEVHLYAMCPERSCGKLIKLPPSKKLSVPGEKCSRKLLTDMTEWPSKTSWLGEAYPRPEWPKPELAEAEPVCGEMLTVSATSTEPLLIFTFRPLQLSLKLVLGRAGSQVKCEQWRTRPTAVPVADPAESGDDEEERKEGAASATAAGAAAAAASQSLCADHFNDVYDGQLWADMQRWPRDQGDTFRGWIDAGDAPDQDDETSLADSIERVEKECLSSFRYDGRLLAAPGTIALQLFVDWYQKHEQGHHSVGLIWACVLNLPREERYELHNMMLVGVLPGPQESSHAQLQGALKVLTAELQVLWTEGVVVGDTRHRVFLFSVVCDTPAMRATCGFGRETSLHGCPYCDGAYAAQKNGAHRDWRPSCTFVGDDLKHAPLTHAQRLVNAQTWLEAVTHDKVTEWMMKQRKKNKNWHAGTVANYLHRQVFTANAKGTSLSGSSRFAALLDLPYFDSVRCAPVDVMHNIMLGLCKHLMSVFTGHHPAAAKAAAEETSEADEVEEEEKEEEDCEDGSNADDCEDCGDDDEASSTVITRRKRTAAPAAAAAAREPKRLKTQGFINPADRQRLQENIDSCPSMPRDIGRIASRLASLDNIKAVEWLNWFTSFAVPSIRSLLPHHPRLTAQHLSIFERAARIVQLSTSYYTTSNMIHELHRELVQVMRDVEALLPDSQSCIKPNMHLSLHLAAQLRDHGPATSWWSFPYERLMGQTANIPFRPGRSSVDTAKRALALLQISSLTTPALDEKSVFGRSGWQLPAGVGFEHGVSRTDNGGRSHWYRFTGPRANAAKHRMHSMRHARQGEPVTGTERYPGLLFNSGKLFDCSLTALTRTLCLSVEHDFVLPWFKPPAHQLVEGVAGCGSKLRANTVVALAFVRQCLLAHHMTIHHKAIHAVYATAAAASLRDSQEESALLSEQSFFTLSTTDRSLVIASVLQTMHDDQKRVARRSHDYSMLIAWYQEQGGGQWDTVSVFDKLFYAGEEFGSDIVSGGQNAWIGANDADDSAVEGVRMWYGRVSYYVRHVFAGRAHDFAMVRWFDFADKEFVKTFPEPRPEAELRSSFADFPIVTSKFRSTDVRDLLPVQRIVGRWISMPSADGKFQYVCPIRSRVHG